MLGCSQPAQRPVEPAGTPRGVATTAGVAATETETPCTLATPLVPGVPGSPGHLIASERNPNGQSELAALMRTMQRELGDVRTALVHGTARAKLLPRFAKIRCAWPTQPSERNEGFDGYAQSYLAAVRGLDEATPATAATAYDQVLSACRNCHEQSCSGAIVAIEALRMMGTRSEK